MSILDAAKVLLRKRQVRRHHDNDSVWMPRRVFVEFARRQGAGRRIDTRENIQELLLALEIGERHILQVGVREPEVGGAAADGRQIAAGMNWITAMGDISHKSPLLQHG